MRAILPISPEYALVLAAITPAGRSAVEGEPAGSVSWAEVLRLAAWHRLGPLLYRHLAPRGDAPAPVLAELERAYLTNAARNLLLRAQLERVLGALAEAGVPTIALKGAALIETVYPEPALRLMTDLDLLVPAGDLDAATAALAAVGYYGPALPAASPRETAAWMRVHHHHDPPLVDHQRIAAVELHHHLQSPALRAGLEIGDVWRRARPGPGRAHRVPAPEDLLLHACLHFMFNRTGRSDGSLGELADIAWIIGGPGVDWAAVTETAREYRLEARVFLALFAARELGIAVPTDPLETLRPAGFDERLGRRLIALRVLRTGAHFPVRSLGWILAPSRDCLSRGWGGDPERWRSLVGAYARRALATLPLALAEPGVVVRDYRLNGQLASLESPPERPPLGASLR